MDENKKLMDDIDSLDDANEYYETNSNYTSNNKSTDGSDLNYEVIKSKVAPSGGIKLFVLVLGVIVFWAGTKFVTSLNEKNQDNLWVDSATSQDEQVNEYGDMTLEELLNVATGEQNNEEENYTKEEIDAFKNSFINSKQRVEVASSFTDVNQSLCVELYNGNTSPLEDLIVYAIFYDEANQIIDIDYNFLNVFHSQSKAIVYFGNTPEVYTRFDVIVSKQYYMEDMSKDCRQLIKIDDKRNEDGSIDIIPNTKARLSGLVATIVYKDAEDKPLGIEYVEFDVEDLGTIRAEGLKNKYTNESIPYDHYIVEVTQAYNYGN